jgi:predicted NACHT family NTPase
MLLTAEPGMGKSTLLSYVEHEIKKCNPATWIVRLNLSEHTKTLKNTEFESEVIEKCKEFVWDAAHSPEQKALELEKELFRQALEETGNVAVILDGFDEISSEYGFKVMTLIKKIMSEMKLMIRVASRSSDRVKLEDIMMKFAFTLQPFN